MNFIHLCDQCEPSNIEYTVACKHNATQNTPYCITFIVQVVHEDLCFCQSFIHLNKPGQYNKFTYICLQVMFTQAEMFNLFRSINFSESISLFFLKK